MSTEQEIKAQRHQILSSMPKEAAMSQLKMARELEELIKHPGWKFYQELLEAQIRNVQQGFMAPLENLLLAPKQEYEKGRANGLLLAYSIVQNTLGVADDLKKLHQAPDKASANGGEKK